MERVLEKMWENGPFFYQTDAARLTTDTVLLADFARVKGSERGADLGCASGALMLLLLWREPRLSMTGFEISPDAAALARENLRLNGVKNAEVVTGDGYAAVTGTFSAIITNPPIRAGKAVIYGLFADARAHLKPGGALYVVIRKQQGAPSALKHLQETYKTAEVIDRGGGFWVIRASME